MKCKKVPFVIFFILLLLHQPSWAENEDISTSIEELDYIALQVTLQNFNAKPEVDGLKVRIFYMNRARDRTISWEWPNTDVIYNISRTRTWKSKKDTLILSGYERISSSSDLIYIRLSRKEQSYGSGILLVTVQFPSGHSFSAKAYVKLSP
jgi:hypothetical protein